MVWKILFLYLMSISIFSSQAQNQKLDMQEVKEFFSPLPHSLINKKNKTNRAKIKLGKKLFFEKRLSLDNDISCNTCHDLKKYGVDGLATSQGHKGQSGNRNAPTVYNSGLFFVQFWDGRADNLQQQALVQILNPIEMAMSSEEAVMKRLKSFEEYPPLFKNAFPTDESPMIFQNVGKAIAAFEKTLITPSRFDRFLRGQTTALNANEKKGLKLFMELGCITCHFGTAIGGGTFQKIGSVEEYSTQDLGRYMITKDDDDKKKFKVPTLRNVAKTGPYFHDGSIKTLDDAVRLEGKHQLGVNLTEKQRKIIIGFLKSLTGKLPKI